jgi:hypothetical protein
MANRDGYYELLGDDRSINIFEGLVELQISEEIANGLKFPRKYDMKGRLRFAFFPYLSPMLEVIGTESSMDFSTAIAFMESIKIQDVSYRNLQLMYYTDELQIDGRDANIIIYTLGELVIGAFKAVKKIKFHILNAHLPNFCTEDLKEFPYLNLEYGRIKIKLTDNRNFDQDNYGYTIGIVGEAFFIDGGEMELEELKENRLFNSLWNFLSFAFSKWVIPTLYIGCTDEDDVVWKKYDRLNEEEYKSSYVIGVKISEWCANLTTEELKLICHLLVKSDFLEEIFFAISWYVRSSKVDTVENSIILTQVALESVAWWYLVTFRQAILMTNYDNLKTGDWLRLMLTFMEINTSVPDRLSKLKKACPKQGLNFMINSIEDGPLSFVNIRNCLVHQSEKNRSKLRNIGNEEIGQAKILGVYYLEMAILKIIGYNGKFNDYLK